MTTSHHTSSPLAALAAHSDSTIGLAALALDTAADNNGWQQLLPAGHFSAVDGRPDDVPGGQWFIDADIANQLITRAQAAQNDLVIDYEHQTLNSEHNGQPAIAAGWFRSDMEWRDGSGLWIKPQWTPRALDHIRNDEYRYLSAVFPYDKRTGTPLALHSAALVNRPGIDGMAAVEALRAANHAHSQTETETETPAMNELMKQLMAKLGIELADGVEPTDEQRTAALAALSALQSKASGADALNTELAALKANGTDTVDLSKHVPAETYNAVIIEMAALKAGSEQSVTDLLDDAHKQGQIIEAERTYLTDLAKQQGVAALKTVLDARAPVADLANQQTKDKKPPDDSGLAVLSADEKKVCAMSGISEDEFLKTKKQLAGTQ